MANAVSKTLRKFGFKGDAYFIDSITGGSVKKKKKAKKKPFTKEQLKLVASQIRKSEKKLSRKRNKK